MQYLIVNIVTIIIIVLVLGPLAWMALRWLDRKIEAGRARQMERARARWARHVNPSSISKGTYT